MGGRKRNVVLMVAKKKCVIALHTGAKSQAKRMGWLIFSSCFFIFSSGRNLTLCRFPNKSFRLVLSTSKNLPLHYMWVAPALTWLSRGVWVSCGGISMSEPRAGAGLAHTN